MTRSLSSCTTCCMLFSVLDDAGRCQRCAERYAAITKQPVSKCFQQPDAPQPTKPGRGRPRIMQRPCLVCLVVKPRDAFPAHYRISNSLRGRCYECLEAHRQERRAARAMSGLGADRPDKGGRATVSADAQGRACAGCHTYKPWHDFYRSVSGFNGYAARCKPCFIKGKRGIRDAIRITDDGRTCTKCHVFRPWPDFYRRTTSPTGHMEACRDCYRSQHLASS